MAGETITTGEAFGILGSTASGVGAALGSTTPSGLPLPLAVPALDWVRLVTYAALGAGIAYGTGGARPAVGALGGAAVAFLIPSLPSPLGAV